MYETLSDYKKYLARLDPKKYWDNLVAYGFIHEDGVKHSQTTACHSDVRFHDRNAETKAIYSITKNKHKISEEDLKRFYRWLLQDSVFSGAFLSKDVHLAVNHGVLVRPDIPSNYLQGALHASRQAWEARFIFGWLKLVKNGCNGDLAMVLTQLMGNYDGKFYSGFNGHNNIDIDVERDAVINLVNHNLVNPNKLWTVNRNYDGVHRMFGTGGPRLYEFVAETIVNISRGVGSTKSNPFGKSSYKEEISTDDEFKQLIKAVEDWLDEGK